jgi:hypothetical protein
VVPSPARASEPAALSPGEVDALVALAEVLADGRVLGAAERRDLAAALEHAVRLDPTRRALHRTTARVLERVGGRGFAGLGHDERVALVKRHRLDLRTRAADEDPPADPEIQTVRARAVPDLIGTYWASAPGWTALGYQAFPGRCGDLTRYTRPGP